MATYSEIQKWVKKKYDFTPKTFWIADVKEQCGMPMRKAHNRRGRKRMYPCPKEKKKAIIVALKHFGMIT